MPGAASEAASLRFDFPSRFAAARNSAFCGACGRRDRGGAVAGLDPDIDDRDAAASTAAIAPCSAGARSAGRRSARSRRRPARAPARRGRSSGSAMRWPIHLLSTGTVAQARHPLLMDLVVVERAIVGDHEQERNAVVRRGPDRGDAHQEVAVAADRDRQAAAALQRERGADRDARAAADAAAAVGADDSRADGGTSTNAPCQDSGRWVSVVGARRRRRAAPARCARW